MPPPGAMSHAYDKTLFQKSFQTMRSWERHRWEYNICSVAKAAPKSSVSPPNLPEPQLPEPPHGNRGASLLAFRRRCHGERKGHGPEVAQVSWQADFDLETKLFVVRPPVRTFIEKQ